MWSTPFDPWVFQLVVNMPTIVFQDELNTVCRQVAIDSRGIGMSYTKNPVSTQGDCAGGCHKSVTHRFLSLAKSGYPIRADSRDRLTIHHGARQVPLCGRHHPHG